MHSSPTICYLWELAVSGFLGCNWCPVVPRVQDPDKWKQLGLSLVEDFSNDPRNIRFDLNTDGMNPFGEMRNPHNT
jgi:hypothetical protein